MRNLKQDLETCKKATKGPYRTVRNNGELLVSNLDSIRIAKIFPENEGNNARFFSQAKEGWEWAILELEKAWGEIERLNMVISASEKKG